MKAEVNQETCISCGLCVSICDSVFEFNEDGKSHVIVDKIPTEYEDDAKDAEAGCPVDAITCEE